MDLDTFLDYAKYIFLFFMIAHLLRLMWSMEDCVKYRKYFAREAPVNEPLSVPDQPLAPLEDTTHEPVDKPPNDKPEDPPPDYNALFP